MQTRGKDGPQAELLAERLRRRHLVGQVHGRKPQLALLAAEQGHGGQRAENLNPSCAVRGARGGSFGAALLVGKACDHGLEPSAR